MAAFQEYTNRTAFQEYKNRTAKSNTYPSFLWDAHYYLIRARKHNGSFRHSESSRKYFSRRILPVNTKKKSEKANTISTAYNYRRTLNILDCSKQNMFFQGKARFFVQEDRSKWSRLSPNHIQYLHR